MLQYEFISVGFFGGRGWVCWSSTVQILYAGLFANKSNHLYVTLQTVFASPLAEGSDESMLAWGLCWNRSVLNKMIFFGSWVIPMALTKSDFRALLIASLALIYSCEWKWSALILLLNINRLWSVCVWEGGGIVWVVGAGRRLAGGCRGTATREVPSLSLVCKCSCSLPELWPCN